MENYKRKHSNILGSKYHNDDIKYGEFTHTEEDDIKYAGI